MRSCDRNLRPRRQFPQSPDSGLRNERAFADGMSELNGEEVCRLHRVGISQTNEPIANRYFSSLDELEAVFIPTVSKTIKSQTPENAV